MTLTNQQIEEILSSPTTDVETAGQILGIGRNTAYKARVSGDIPAIKVGGQYRVPTAKLRAILQGGSQPAQTNPSVVKAAKRRGRPPSVKPNFDDVLKHAREGRNVKVSAIADATGLSLNGFYAAARRGDIQTIRVGRAVLVPGDEALRLLGENAGENHPASPAETSGHMLVSTEQFRAFTQAICETIRQELRTEFETRSKVVIRPPLSHDEMAGFNMLMSDWANSPAPVGKAS